MHFHKPAKESEKQYWNFSFIARYKKMNNLDKNWKILHTCVDTFKKYENRQNGQFQRVFKKWKKWTNLTFRKEHYNTGQNSKL